MFKLRETWAVPGSDGKGYFEMSTLYKIDMNVHALDPAWPIKNPGDRLTTTNNAEKKSTAAAAAKGAAKSIHVNPAFLNVSKILCFFIIHIFLLVFKIYLEQCLLII